MVPPGQSWGKIFYDDSSTLFAAERVLDSWSRTMNFTHRGHPFSPAVSVERNPETVDRKRITQDAFELIRAEAGATHSAMITCSAASGRILFGGEILGRYDRRCSVIIWNVELLQAKLPHVDLAWLQE